MNYSYRNDNRYWTADKEVSIQCEYCKAWAFLKGDQRCPSCGAPQKQKTGQSGYSSYYLSYTCCYGD